MKRILKASAMIVTLGLTAGLALATDQQRIQSQTHKQDQIYGRQLMTEQERIEFRDKIRAAKTVEERDLIRRQQHDQMTARAKERGVTFPTQPPDRSGGMGPGAVGGMGPGGGAGRGR